MFDEKQFRELFVVNRMNHSDDERRVFCRKHKLTPNIYPGRCVITGHQIEAKRGFVFRDKENGVWHTVGPSGLPSYLRKK